LDWLFILVIQLEIGYYIAVIKGKYTLFKFLLKTFAKELKILFQEIHVLWLYLKKKLKEKYTK